MGLAGENFTLKAEGNAANEIIWQDIQGREITTSQCVSVDDKFTAFNEGDDTKCYLSGTFEKDRNALYSARFQSTGDYYHAVVVTIGQ